MHIINLTIHKATDLQILDGVFNLEGDLKQELDSILLFHTLPDKKELNKRKEALSSLIEKVCSMRKVDAAMIGGALYFNKYVAEACIENGIIPLYSFSERQVVETTENNQTKKQVVFYHKGFVEA